MRQLDVRCEEFELKQPFSISRGSIDAITVVVVEIEDGHYRGKGECVPSASRMVSREEGAFIAEEARQQILLIKEEIEKGVVRELLPKLIKDAPARNAVDYALWDLEVQITNQSIWDKLEIPQPEYFDIAYTFSLDEVANDNKSLGNQGYNLLKIKLGNDDDIERVAAIHQKLPKADIIVDVNEAWSLETLRLMTTELKELGVKLIEQPLPRGKDSELTGFNSVIPLCADESCRDRTDLSKIAAYYDYINIKLDKTGGLTEALALTKQAQELNLGIMVGCMAGTSLSMSAALPIASQADYVDLDGPLLLKRDRPNGLTYSNGRMFCI